MINYGDITIKTHETKSKKDKNFILVTAEKELKELPSKTDKNLVKVPKDIIKELEQSLENVVNIISLCERLKRSISSTIPSIFLIITNDNEKKFLSDAKGFDFEKYDRVKNAAIIKFDIEFCLKNLNDRLDGIQIISEANSSEHLSGKFHEYFKFLERAFKRANRGLIEPLSKFLEQNSILGYTKEEIENWITVRHKSIHANRRDGYFVEGDIRPFISRIEQASYEVLFNKKTWHDRSSNRRNLFQISAGTKSSSNEIFAYKGAKMEMRMQLLDETGSYPLNLNAMFNKLNDNWWAPLTKDLKLGGNKLEVIENEE